MSVRSILLKPTDNSVTSKDVVELIAAKVRKKDSATICVSNDAHINWTVIKFSSCKQAFEAYETLKNCSLKRIPIIAKLLVNEKDGKEIQKLMNKRNKADNTIKNGADGRRLDNGMIECLSCPQTFPTHKFPAHIGLCTKSITQIKNPKKLDRAQSSKIPEKLDKGSSTGDKSAIEDAAGQPPELDKTSDDNNFEETPILKNRCQPPELDKTSDDNNFTETPMLKNLCQPPELDKPSDDNNFAESPMQKNLYQPPELNTTSDDNNFVETPMQKKLCPPPGFSRPTLSTAKPLLPPPPGFSRPMFSSDMPDSASFESLEHTDEADEGWESPSANEHHSVDHIRTANFAVSEINQREPVGLQEEPRHFARNVRWTHAASLSPTDDPMSDEIFQSSDSEASEDMFEDEGWRSPFAADAQGYENARTVGHTPTNLKGRAAVEWPARLHERPPSCQDNGIAATSTPVSNKSAAALYWEQYGNKNWLTKFLPSQANHQIHDITKTLSNPVEATHSLPQQHLRHITISDSLSYETMASLVDFQNQDDQSCRTEHWVAKSIGKNGTQILGGSSSYLEPNKLISHQLKPCNLNELHQELRNQSQRYVPSNFNKNNLELGPSTLYQEEIFNAIQMDENRKREEAALALIKKALIDENTSHISEYPSLLPNKKRPVCRSTKQVGTSSPGYSAVMPASRPAKTQPACDYASQHVSQASNSYAAEPASQKSPSSMCGSYASERVQQETCPRIIDDTIPVSFYDWDDDAWEVVTRKKKAPLSSGRGDAAPTKANFKQKIDPRKNQEAVAKDDISNCGGNPMGTRRPFSYCIGENLEQLLLSGRDKKAQQACHKQAKKAAINKKSAKQPQSTEDDMTNTCPIESKFKEWILQSVENKENRQDDDLLKEGILAKEHNIKEQWRPKRRVKTEVLADEKKRK